MLLVVVWIVVVVLAVLVLGVLAHGLFGGLQRLGREVHALESELRPLLAAAQQTAARAATVAQRPAGGPDA